MLNTIIFDMGNVIVDVSADRTIAAFEQLGIQQGSNIFTLQKQNALCDQLEVGEIDSDTFLNALAGYTPHEVDKAALLDAWQAMIMHTTPERLNLLKALREHYDVFLLSNTNEIHYGTINCHLKTHGVDQLESLFDRTYLSYQVGHRKPTQEIFEHVANDANLVASETLFIDDLLANLEVPKAMGWQTWHAADLSEIWSKVDQLIPKK